jgi:hypothetical protein
MASTKTKHHEKQIDFDNADRGGIAAQALEDKVILEALIENLGGDVRRIRQFSAAAVNVASQSDPEAFVPYIPELLDALHRPEAQTRWECLETLSRVCDFDPAACEDGVVGAEPSLYDEESGPARLAAMRFLCAYGATGAKRSEKVWPFVDEAIQCYHGDPEFNDMLACVTAFAGGKIDKGVKAALAARMGFDAENAKGSLARRAAQIIELCNAK